MTTILERCIALIAPNRCLNCSNVNNLLCDDCIATSVAALPPNCVLCWRPHSMRSSVCPACRRQTGIDGLWVASAYNGQVAELIQGFKFSRQGAAAKPLAQLLANVLPHLPPDIVIVPVPTATPHMRVRGYDHAWLLAKELGGILSVKALPALARNHNLSQKGAANRKQRATQARAAFRVAHPALVQERRILLIDDVITTGSTLIAAATALKTAGAKKVYVVAVAHQLSKTRKYDKIG